METQSSTQVLSHWRVKTEAKSRQADGIWRFKLAACFEDAFEGVSEAVVNDNFQTISKENVLEAKAEVPNILVRLHSPSVSKDNVLASLGFHPLKGNPKPNTILKFVLKENVLAQEISVRAKAETAGATQTQLSSDCARLPWAAGGKLANAT